VIVRKEPGAQMRFPDIGGHQAPASPPAPRPASLLIWSCINAAAPGVRTGSATPKSLGYVTSRCTAPARTRSDVSWWPWPATSLPGRRCLPLTGPSRSGNPDACACACSPPQSAWPVAVGRGSASLPRGPRPSTSPSRPHAGRPWLPADQPEPSQLPGKEKRGPVDPPPA
jgi:hypothetical protein